MLTAVLILASCAGNPLAGLPTTRAPSASSAPPSVAVAPTAKPSKAPKPQDLAIAAFVKSVTTGKWSYRIAFEGRAAGSADSLPIVGGMDVSGVDFASSWTYDFSKEYDNIGKIRLQVRAVKGHGYIKSGTGAWKTIKGYDDSDSYVPFKAVTSVEDVKYLAPVTIGGTEFHKVSIPKAVLINPTTIPFNIRGEKIDSTTLEIVIDSKGRPRQGVWKLKGQARVGGSGQLQRIIYELDLTFSKVGAKLTITKP